MKFLAQLFVLFCFFPYLDFLRIGTDTQPNALVVGALILLGVKHKKINFPLVLLWIVFGFSLFLIFYNNLSFFLYLKNTLNYLSPALVATTTYVLLDKMNFKVKYKWFAGMMVAYTLIGLIQLYLIPNFLNFMVNGAGRGTLIGGRGVVSLFSEPAFYGTNCLFFMSFSLLSYSRKQNFYMVILLLFQVFFLSRSATAIAIFAAGLGLFTLVQLLRFKFGYMMIFLLVVMISAPIVLHYWSKVESTRAGELASTFIENPLLITQVDGSVGIRFTGSIAPFLSMRHHYMKPQGHGYYIEFLRGLREQRLYLSFLNLNNSENKPRLGGSMNMILYQLGFLGLIFPLAVYLAFRGQLSSDAILFAFILFLVTMMTQIQLMNGMIGFIIGSAIYYGKQLSSDKLTTQRHSVL